MSQPPDRGSKIEAEEIDREMEMIEREGGGVAEAAPLRRLAYLAAIVVVLGVLWYFWR